MSRTKGSELVHKLNALVEDAQGKKPCKLCVALAALDPQIQNGVKRAIAARRPDGKRAIGPVKLTSILQDSGIDVGSYSVERHLKENHGE